MPALFLFPGRAVNSSIWILFCDVFASFVKRTTVDLQHEVVDFDYVRLEQVIIGSIHALNPERDLHRGCTNHGLPSAQLPLTISADCEFGNEAVRKL